MLPYLGLTLLALLSIRNVYAQDFSMYGYATLNGGTTGGAGGTVVNVTTREDLIKEVAGTTPKTIFVTGDLGTSDHRINVGSNKTIIGTGAGAIITGGGFTIIRASNVIIRNFIVGFVQGNDGITIQKSTNIWIDHNEFHSDLDHGFDFYDGQVDLTHAVDFVTLSWNVFRTHFKSSLVGHDPANAAEDTGKFHLTYHHNYWLDVHTRTPALRFAHTHVYNNFLQNVVSQGVHSRSFAQVLVEGNVFQNVTQAISTYGFVIPDDSPANPTGDFEPDGFANERGNDFGGSKNNITQVGNFTKVDYTFPLDALSDVKRLVTGFAGAGKIKV